MVLYEQVPDQPADQVLAMLGERLEQAFAEPFSVQGERLAVKASVGLVAAGPEELGYELLGRADELMYRRKSQHATGGAEG